MVMYKCSWHECTLTTLHFMDYMNRELLAQKILKRQINKVGLDLIYLRTVQVNKVLKTNCKSKNECICVLFSE